MMLLIPAAVRELTSTPCSSTTPSVTVTVPSLLMVKVRLDCAAEKSRISIPSESVIVSLPSRP